MTIFQEEVLQLSMNLIHRQCQQWESIQAICHLVEEVDLLEVIILRVKLQNQILILIPRCKERELNGVAQILEELEMVIVISRNQLLI
jgi:hypothetical protein